MRLVMLCVLLAFCLVLKGPTSVLGHGMMLDPPQRSSMWRYFGTLVPANYNDMGLNCGGAGTQHNTVNAGRCGECGDEWSLPRPRLNDEGGKYGTGIIGRIYKETNMVNITVRITANHMGHFEFRLCPKKSSSELVTQDCLDSNLLQFADGGLRYYLPSSEAKTFYPVIKLPEGVTCMNCVLQWRYTTGNSWGVCSNGRGALGCGNQETFVNCADIAILPL